MKKINVIGTTGSGKSTFSERLAKKLGYPCIHMDQLFWKANWEESSDDEFMAKVTAAVSREAWVLDGNYSRTSDIKWGQADTVIWLDCSFPRTFFQLLGRTITRAVTKEELWPGTGNRESFRKSFMSKDSIFMWLFRYYKINKRRYAALESTFESSHIKFVRLRSRRAADAFIEKA